MAIRPTDQSVRKVGEAIAAEQARCLDLLALAVERRAPVWAVEEAMRTPGRTAAEVVAESGPHPWTPDPRRISDFMLEHWAAIDDEGVRIHFIALCKALYRRVGQTRAEIQLRAAAEFVAQLET